MTQLIELFTQLNQLAQAPASNLGLIAIISLALTYIVYCFSSVAIFLIHKIIINITF